MVTYFKGHWDERKKTPNSKYTLTLIEDGIGDAGWSEEPIPTLFIKISEGGIFEKCWIGYSKNFKPYKNTENKHMCFDVELSGKEVQCPKEFLNYKSGWYLNKENIEILYNTKEDLDINIVSPPFFNEMAKCSWRKFERYCTLLLKLLGITDIHAFEENPRGKADGFFKLSDLSVLYDATLEDEFDLKKETQFQNFINQLKEDKFYVGSKSYSITPTRKQVWIITRHDNVRIIKEEDGIRVIEVPYTKLIEIYDKRLRLDINTIELSEMLKNLDK